MTTTTAPAQRVASPAAIPAVARPPRLALLDGLRLVAAVAVVLFHWTAWHHGHWGSGTAREAWPVLSRLSVFGNMGVQLFFIISGFVILLSSYGKTPARFIGSRIGRLYPAYWAAVLLTGALVLFFWPETGVRLSISDWAMNLTMFQQGFGVPHVDGVYWTLWAEMRFYGWILALMLLGLLTPGRLVAFAALWPTLGLFEPLITAAAGGNWAEQVLIPEHSPLFAGGMALFLIYRFGHTPLRWAVLLYNVVLAAHHTGATGSREALELVGYQVPEQAYWGIVAGLFAVVAALSLTPLRSVSLPGMALAGALTYPVYLLHEIWGWWLISVLSPVLPRPVVLVLALAVVFAAAYLVNRHLEQRFGPALGRWASRSVEAAGRLAGSAVRSAGRRPERVAPDRT
ncbi:acyltransferase [Arthrobacter ginkgonis]|uniref:Acyltransferase n=1 Tax=Arthrobacter ginkgonis TaxID=1630594 RepID=A0ABP7BYE5_9MICC